MQLVLDTELSKPVRWALDRLRQVLLARGEPVQERTTPESGHAILVGLAGGSAIVDQAIDTAGLHCPEASESLVVHRVDADRLLITGRDERGLVYALLDSTRAIELSAPDLSPFDAVYPAVESPTLDWRSMQLFLCNQKLEREWFYREDFWEAYLSQLVLDRYNNLSLTYAHQTNYLAPCYPFLVEMPEFPQVVPLDFSPEERQQHLDMLRRISEMARDRALHFTFGLWTQDADSYGEPTVQGLDEENLVDFNAVGLKRVLEACPAIDGVQFRMNSESGIPENRQIEFYEKQFRAVAECDRPIRLDLRAKGLSNETIQLACDLVPSTVISTKHWCEHQGLPYPMPAIQKRDINSYRRYGIWDLLQKPRNYPLVHRLWSAGSQRVLLWGDPEWVKRFTTSCRFGGIGFEVMAPLTNKGFRADTEPWNTIEDPEYQPYLDEIQRYWMFDLLFGRLGYNPDTPAEVWERELRVRFGTGAGAVGELYRVGGKILPLLTTVLQYSASMWGFWPEMFAGRSLEEDIRIEPSDPTQFYRVNEYVEDTANGRLCGKWTPPHYAAHLRQLAAETRDALSALGTESPSDDPELRGTRLDFAIVADLADYHACRLLATTHLAFYHQTENSAHLQAARQALQQAEPHWASISAAADGVYHSYLIFGREQHRGHWKDRLKVVQDDLEAIDQLLEADAESGSPLFFEGGDIHPDPPDITFTPPLEAKPDSDLILRMHARSDATVETVRCYYRIANQVLSFECIDTESVNDGYSATIPGTYIDGQWDLMVFFEFVYADGGACRWPDWRLNTPYIVIPVVNRI